MDIVIEQIPEEPAQSQLQRETTGRPDTLDETQLNAALHASAEEQPEDAPPEPPPTPKRRGRPPGSKNKPRIIEEIPEEPIILNEPPVEESPVEEPPPKKKKPPHQESHAHPKRNRKHRQPPHKPQYRKRHCRSRQVCLRFSAWSKPSANTERDSYTNRG